MLLQCPECGQQVSDQASACPHCGYPLNTNQSPSSNEFMHDPVQQDWGRDEKPSKRERKHGLAWGCFSAGIVLLIITVVSFGIFLAALRLNAGGIAVSLRKLAETDAGDGSHGDNSAARIAVKYYLLNLLDFVEGTPDLPRQVEKPKKKILPPPVQDVKQKPVKTELPPLEMPPELPK